MAGVRWDRAGPGCRPAEDRFASWSIVHASPPRPNGQSAWVYRTFAIDGAPSCPAHGRRV